MQGCRLTSLMVCINARTHDIRERNVTIRGEIWTKNICSLEFRYQRVNDITGVDITEFRVQLMWHVMASTNVAQLQPYTDVEGAIDIWAPGERLLSTSTSVWLQRLIKCGVPENHLQRSKAGVADHVKDDTLRLQRSLTL
jgi:hypothetical protein